MGGSALPTSPLPADPKGSHEVQADTVPATSEAREPWRFPWGCCFQAPGPLVGKPVCVGAHASSPVNWTPVEAGEGTRGALVLRPRSEDSGTMLCRGAEFIPTVMASLRPRGKRLSCSQEGGALNDSVCSRRGLGSSRFCKISPMIRKKTLRNVILRVACSRRGLCCTHAWL